ncbi:SRPBCC family protein [Brachybacterium sp. EF45031]|uniref:SRPBCC family protein n=1 Tax=Brachybacterium sillae TaxID=2810536 RepID=UPI00217E9DDD|nr:SRPBCC family protein [Brachybacterium sillae]MCS6711811.1 SRPBCC family protein [Brachybacterium sillae]
MPIFERTRHRHTSAAPQQVLPLLQDFHEWETWSLWEGVDPQLRREYSGPERGTGARYAWSGNKKAGAGSMEVVRADDHGIAVDLRFTKPFRAHNDVRVDVVEARDGGSDLFWTMTGEQNVLVTLLFRVMRMEKALARDFDRGLAQPAAEAEKGAAAR